MDRPQADERAAIYSTANCHGRLKSLLPTVVLPTTLEFV